MTRVRWEPARELSTLQHEMNRVFGSLFDTPTTARAARPSRAFVPAMDLVEAEEHYVLRADLPGVDPSDVAIDVEDRVLTIAGERRTEDTAGASYARLERATGAFRRSLTLPQGVDAAQIVATFDRGVLEVRVPKPEQAKPRRIEIAVGSGQDTLEAPADEA